MDAEGGRNMSNPSKQHGNGGGNVPMTLQIRSGCEGGGKGALIQENLSATLSTHNTKTLFDPIPIADKATRHNGGGDSRNDDGAGNGLGVGEPGAPAYTLTSADRHAVACSDKTYQKVSGPLMANSHPGSYTGQDAFSDMLVANNYEYIVRRLTPLECCRLQGFPDNWADDIAIENPPAKVIREWMIAWAEWWRLIGRAEGIQLPKDAKAVERWLKDPASDSGLYKMWGNGIALPNAMFVMEGIAMVLQQENQNEQTK